MSEDAAKYVYCEITIGQLLRNLNLKCVKATEAGDIEAAKEVARLSGSVEEALRFSGLMGEVKE